MKTYKGPLGEVTAFHYDGANRAEIVNVAPEKINYRPDQAHINVQGEHEFFQLHPGQWMLKTEAGHLVGMDHNHFVASHKDYAPERKKPAAKSASKGASKKAAAKKK